MGRPVLVIAVGHGPVRRQPSRSIRSSRQQGGRGRDEGCSRVQLADLGRTRRLGDGQGMGREERDILRAREMESYGQLYVRLVLCFRSANLTCI